MKTKKKILIFIGTRPEAIKLAPVAISFMNDPKYETKIVSTGQHKELLLDSLKQFNLEPSINLEVMTENQTLSKLTSTLFLKISELIDLEKPNLVFAQGDTTTVFVTSTVCFYHNIAFAHVEAGLRSNDINSPFPEEFNRRTTGLTTSLHFAPTEKSAENLRSEGVAMDKIFIVGNSVIDALKITAEKLTEVPFEIPKDKKIILVTAHRRENFGEPHLNIFEAIREIAQKRQDVYFVYPVHPNPNVKHVAHNVLGDIPNILLTSPVNYSEMVHLLKSCTIALTDSGGIQEEAPFLGKPVLILRNETERTEVVEEHLAILCSNDKEKIISETNRLLDDKGYYLSYVKNKSPYGDGNTSNKIKSAIDNYFLG